MSELQRLGYTSRHYGSLKEDLEARAELAAVVSANVFHRKNITAKRV